MHLRSLGEIRAALMSGRITPEELLRSAGDRNRQLDDDARPIAAFLSTIQDGPGENGRERVRRTQPDGPKGERARVARVAHKSAPLAGVPIAVKDNICTDELPTTCASRILEGYQSPFSATAVRRLVAAGATIFGKTNLDEFAMGSSTENSAYGPTRNPVDRSRVPGGSSGGSAAAVAAGVVPVALGSTTGGSARQPAAFCGIVGVKPTYGRVSRYGLVAFASSLDQIAVLARTVRDAATVLETISGFDRFDATSQNRPLPRAVAIGGVELAGQVIGVPREYFDERLDPSVREIVERVLELAVQHGAKVRQISLPSTDAALSCYYVIAPAEASSNLARFDGVRYGFRAWEADTPREMYERSRGEGFGPEVKRRIMMGSYALSEGYHKQYYLRAQRIRGGVASDMSRAFADGIDAIFAPTTPTPAFRLGEKSGDPYAMCLADVYTVSANLAGIPAVSIPIGNSDGLPVGGQLMCPRWEEERMLGLAARLEELVEYEHPSDRAEAVDPDPQGS